MRITDELREWGYGFCGDTHDVVTAIADRIDAEHESAWVELPKDADGEYIHSGDVLDGYGKTIEVVEMRHGRGGWVLISRDGNGYADTFAFAHHKPTVEDVLQEFSCVLMGKREFDGDVAEAISEYAAKLRLAEGEVA